MTSQQSSAAGADSRSRLLEDIPLTEHQRDLAGIATAVLEGGDGPPIVLLHGPGEFAALWARIVPDLVQTHRVVAPDLPGHGATELPSTLDAGRVLRWLGDLIEQTCSSRPILVGRLMGGAIAARFAIEHGDRLDSIVLADTYGLAMNRPALRFAIPLATFVAHPTERSRDRFFAQCFTDFDGLVQQLGNDFVPFQNYALEWARTKTAKPALRALMPEFGMRAISKDDLAAIQVPTTLIHGRDDLQTRLSVVERASSQYGWPLHVIEDCRDDPSFERPAAFLEALRTAISTDEEQK